MFDYMIHIQALVWVWFISARLSVPGDHEVASQLNGSCGEVTGSDDIDAIIDEIIGVNKTSRLIQVLRSGEGSKAAPVAKPQTITITSNVSDLVVDPALKAKHEALSKQLAKHAKVASQLEYMKKDLAKASFAHASGKGGNKAAQDRINNKLANEKGDVGKTKNQYGPPDPTPAEAAAWPARDPNGGLPPNRFDALEVEDPVLKVVEYEVVPLKELLVFRGVGSSTNAVYNGKQVLYAAADGVFTSSNGTICDTLPAGTFHLGIKTDIGYITVSDKAQKKGPEPKMSRGMAAFKDVDTPAFTANGKACPSVMGRVFLPALEVIKREFPSACNTELHRIQTVQGYILREYPSISQEDALRTSKYWFFQQACQKRVLLLGQSTLMMTNISTMVIEPRISRVTNGLGISRIELDIDGHATIEKRSHTTCEKLIEYVPKRIFDIKAFGTAGVEFTGDETDDDFRYPAFVERHEPERRYRSIFFSLLGEGEEFVAYDQNGSNVCMALPRMLAGRDDEEVYYSNQAQAYMELCRHGFIPKRISTVLKLDCLLTDVCDTLVVGNGLLKHRVVCPVLDRSPALPAIITGVQKLLSRVSRWALTKAMDKTRNVLNWAYFTIAKNITEVLDPFDGRQAAANIKHINKKLREEYVRGVVLHCDEDSMVQRLTAKVKDELAKYGKYPRLYVSYEAGCMYANELPELVKVCLNGGFHFAAGELGDVETFIYIFSKPSHDGLSQLFQSLIESTRGDNVYTVILYSDDSVHSGNIDGKSFGYNVDIASNDSSTNSLIFGVTGAILAQFSKARAAGLLRQCTLPITVRDPNSPSDGFTINFHSAFEGSGTVLTTILNHIGCFLGACASASFMKRANPLTNPLGCDPADAILSGYRAVGHKVTIGAWGVWGQEPVYEKIQFLKRSPLYDGKRWVPFLNYGCILRSLGSVDGDMTPLQLSMTVEQFRVTPLEKRMEIYWSSVVRGLVHEPSSPVLIALRERFLTAGTFTTEKFSVMESDVCFDSLDQASFNADRLCAPSAAGSSLEEAMCARYGVSSLELQILCDQIRGLELGSRCVSRAATMIYNVDYEVPLPVGYGPVIPSS